MTTNEFNKEYYLMNIDGASNHPLLSWGKTDYDLFVYSNPINSTDLEIPLQVKFRKPYPKKTEIADLLFLGSNFAVSEKFKLLFEKINIYGIQFFPVEIETDKKKKITGYYALHSWNGIPAIDKNKYVGDDIDENGMILDVEKFSLDTNVLEAIPLEKRMVFHLAETYDKKILVHQSVHDAIKAENLTGMRFFRVDEWDDDAMFR